jgi:hypothetical protein
MLSINQVMHEIKDLELQAYTLFRYPSHPLEFSISRFKSFISTSTSLSIVFLHFKLLRNSLLILYKALKIDVKLFFEQSPSYRIWPGRVILYCSLAFLLVKCNDSRSSLKFLYDCNVLISEIKDQGKEIHDYQLLHSILYFLVLTQGKEYVHGEKYLKEAIIVFNDITDRFDDVARINIYVILEILRIVMANLSEGCVISVRNVLQSVEVEKSDFSSVSGLFSKLKRIRAESALVLITSEKFFDIVFLTLFFPFVSSSTPLVHLEELKRAQGKQKPLTRSDPSHLISPSKHLYQDNYSLLMKSALEAIKFPPSS